METITLTRPDDWHLHLRDGAALAAVLPDTARRFGRAVVMPNLKPPVVTTADALAYRSRVLEALPPGADFEPLMTLYLTESSTPEEMVRARAAGVFAVKYYPAGATTNSEAGVTGLEKSWPVLEAMEREGMAFLVHGEVTDPAVDIFDRERVFLERTLAPLVERFPGLRVVLEHVTTREGVDFVRGARAGVGATITAHHLLINRNAIFQGGIRPHHYCLPVAKRESHRQALLDAATSGDARFFLGTDSAPHARHAKETSCGCAGIYTSHGGIELYAEAFEERGALERLEAFASFNGPDFHGLPRNQGTITLVKEAQPVPEELPYGRDRLVPFRAGGTLAWRLRD